MCLLLMLEDKTLGIRSIRVNTRNYSKSVFIINSNEARWRVTFVDATDSEYILFLFFFPKFTGNVLMIIFSLFYFFHPFIYSNPLVYQKNV